ncbi:hypothetical protein ACFLZW_03660 [Chloroflexota bacterium]
MSYNAWLYVEGNPANNADPAGKCYDENADGICDHYPNYIDVENFNEKISPAGISFIPAYRNIHANIFDSRGNRVSPGTNQSQFKVGGFTHYDGLCGNISVAAILTLTYPQIDAGEVVEQAERFQNGANWLWAQEIAALFNVDYGDYWKAESGSITHWIPRKESEPLGLSYWKSDDNRSFWNKQIETWISSGNQFVFALVQANGSEGRLYNTRRGANHWVVITGISNPFYKEKNWASSKNWVRIYNPFDNQTEYYPWSYFRASWEWENTMILVEQTSSPPPLNKCGR